MRNWETKTTDVTRRVNTDVINQQYSADKENSPARKPYSLPIILHIQFISKSCWHYFQSYLDCKHCYHSGPSHYPSYVITVHSYTATLLLPMLSTGHFLYSSQYNPLKIKSKAYSNGFRVEKEFAFRIKPKSLLWHDFTAATSLTSSYYSSHLTPTLLQPQQPSGFSTSRFPLSKHSSPRSQWFASSPFRPSLDVTSDRPCRTIQLKF